MKKLLQDWLWLFFLGLTATLLVQTLEFPYHLEFFRFQTLFLPLWLFSAAVFLFLGVPFLSIVLIIFSLLGWKIFWVKRHQLKISLGIYLLATLFFQRWAIRHALLSVPLSYYLALLFLLIIFFTMSLNRRLRIGLAALSPVVLLLMIGIRYAKFHIRPWTTTGKGPNVLLLVADTTRKDHVGFYGYSRETTPFLSMLAKHGAVFDDVLSSSSWTKPAMASLLSSRYLTQDRILTGPLPLEWPGMRLAEFFKKVGYDTALFTANPNTGSYFEATKGYDWILQSSPPDHFALPTFVLPKLFQTYARMKEWLKFKNASNRLAAFQEVLGFSTLTELSRFSRGQVPSETLAKFPGFGSSTRTHERKPIRFTKAVGEEPNPGNFARGSSERIPPLDVEAYRNQVKMAFMDYFLFNLRISKQYPSWRMKYVVPLADPIYRAILKFCFITLEDSRGKVVDHWIRDGELTRSFVDWFEHQYDTQRPFFAHLQYMGPHTPYQEQPPNLLPYFDPDNKVHVENPPSQHKLPSQGAKELKPEELHNMVANYDDQIRNVDANVKMVLDFLKNKGVLENTLVVFLADHGEAFYEHKIYGHMYSLYSELVNIPLLFYWPQKIKTERSQLPASIVDIFPTVATLSGQEESLKKVEGLEGVPLFASDGTLTTADLKDRIRYGTTRMTIPKKEEGKKETMEGRRKRRADREMRKPPEAIHRMVVYQGQKLVEEIEDKKRRLFLFSLTQPQEPLKEIPRDDPAVEKLYRLFGKLPADYQDVNEPEVRHSPLEF